MEIFKQILVDELSVMLSNDLQQGRHNRNLKKKVLTPDKHPLNQYAHRKAIFGPIQVLKTKIMQMKFLAKNFRKHKYRFGAQRGRNLSMDLLSEIQASVERVWFQETTRNSNEVQIEIWIPYQ